MPKNTNSSQQPQQPQQKNKCKTKYKTLYINNLKKYLYSIVWFVEAVEAFLVKKIYVFLTKKHKNSCQNPQTHNKNKQ